MARGLPLTAMERTMALESTEAGAPHDSEDHDDPKYAKDPACTTLYKRYDLNFGF